MNRVSDSDRAEFLIFLNEFNEKRNDSSKNEFIIKKLLSTKKLTDNEKIEYAFQISKMLKSDLLLNRVNDIKLADLSYFTLIYFKTLKQKARPTPTHTEAKNWYKRVSNLKNNLIEILKESPNKNRTEQFISYIRKDSLINIIKKLREDKVIAHIDKDMAEFRYNNLKKIIENKFNNNQDILMFLDLLRDRDYISPLSFSEHENSNECNKKIYNHLIFNVFNLIDYKYFDYIESFFFDVYSNLKTNRNDEYIHRTSFIKELYNANGKAKNNEERPYSIELISTLILILYEESNDLDYNSAINKVKKIIKNQ